MKMRKQNYVVLILSTRLQLNGMSLRGEIPALSSTTSSAIIDVDSVHFDMPTYNAGSLQECSIQYLCKHKHLHTGPITATTAAATAIKDNADEKSSAAEDFSTSSCSETEDEDSQAYR